VKGIVVIYFAGGGTNSSCAMACGVIKKKIIMYPAIETMIELLLRRTLELLVLQSSDDEDT